MAYLERSAIVRIHTITNSSTAVSSATLLPVTSLNYAHNGRLQEENRLAFTQLMTTARTGGIYGYFSHVVRTDEYTTTSSIGLPAHYRTGAERPLSAGNGLDMGEISCALIQSSSAYEVGIQTMDSNYYNDNVVDNSVLIEIS
jgi:hypothetical protein